MIPTLDFARPRGAFINRVKAKGENLTAYEVGGIGLADPSQGLEVQLWEASCLNGRDIYINSRSTGRLLLIPNAGEGISNLDLAFDQNMYPFLTWKDRAGVCIYWYDPTAPGYVVERFLQRIRSPRCTLDDKRDFNVANSDIVFTYIREDTQRICARLQRDRYGIEYDLASVYDVPGVTVRDARDVQIRAVNMANTLRLQWEFDVLRNVFSVGYWTRLELGSPMEVIE